MKKTLILLFVATSFTASFSQEASGTDPLLIREMREDCLFETRKDLIVTGISTKHVDQQLALYGVFFPAKVEIWIERGLKFMTFRCLNGCGQSRFEAYSKTIKVALPFVKSLEYDHEAGLVTASFADTLPGAQIDRLLRYFSYDGFVESSAARLAVNQKY